MAVKFKQTSAVGAVNLTSLIDVVFLLLIFIMVTARFEKEDRQLKVALPSASEAKPLTEETSKVFVNIDERGQYVVDGAVLRTDEVEAKLLQKAADNPANTEVIIRADARVAFEFVVAIMNVCNRAGISDYSVTTQDR
jgi:biopolymer transport protein ExbD